MVTRIELPMWQETADPMGRASTGKHKDWERVAGRKGL